MRAEKLRIGLSVVLLAALGVGEACKKQEEAAGDTPTAPPDATAAVVPTAAVDDGIREAAAEEPAGGGCPHAAAASGTAAGGCPHAAAASGTASGGCPHAAAASGTAGGGCPHAAAASGTAAGGCPHATAGTPPDPVPVTSIGPLNLPIQTAGELAPERIGQEATCPVGGERYTVTAKTPAIRYQGRVELFGCMGCAEAYAKNPDAPEQPPCPHHGP